MSKSFPAFSYKNGNSFVHRMPAWIKILILPVLGVLFFNLPFYFSGAVFLLQLVLCFYLKFTVKQVLQDFKPIIYYAVLLYFTSFIARFCSSFFSGEFNYEAFETSVKLAVNASFLDTSTAVLLLRLFTVMQSASIMFKTSSSLQIREGVGTIESAVRKVLPVSKKNKFTNTVSLFVCFIPMVYRNWEQCKRAWFARGGKKNLRMYIAIFPVFFSCGIKQAYNASRALLSRS